MRFDDHPDWDETDHRLADLSRLAGESPSEGLAAVAAAADELPDDRLCQLGVEVLEALLDLHWFQIGEEFVRLAEGSSNLRKALSCAWLHIDEEVEERLQGLIRPGEDIGRQSTSEPLRPEWNRLRHPAIREVRLTVLLGLIQAAELAGLAIGVDTRRLNEVSDGGALHLLWPRFRCDPVRRGLPFYRCGVLVHLSHQAIRDAVFEVDLLIDDVEALPELAARRGNGLLRGFMERLPSIDEV